MLFLAGERPAPDSASIADFVRERRTVIVAHAFGTSNAREAAQDVPVDDVGSLTRAEWAALYELGESPVRDRAEDVLLAARQLINAGLAANRKVDLVADGVMAVPALHAAVLAPDLFDHVTVRHAPRNWNDLFTLERSFDMRDNFVPGVLQVPTTSLISLPHSATGSRWPRRSTC